MDGVKLPHAPVLEMINQPSTRVVDVPLDKRLMSPTERLQLDVADGIECVGEE